MADLQAGQLAQSTGMVPDLIVKAFLLSEEAPPPDIF